MFFLYRRCHDYRRYTGEDLYQNKTADTIAVVRQTGKPDVFGFSGCFFTDYPHGNGKNGDMEGDVGHAAAFVGNRDVCVGKVQAAFGQSKSSLHLWFCIRRGGMFGQPALWHLPVIVN